MKKKLEYLDVLRVVAMFMVLINHTIASEISNVNNSILSVVFCTFAMCISRLGVPIFLMLSGALFLEKSKGISLKNLYRQYITRILFPLCVWSVIYYVLYDVIQYKDATFGSLASLLLRPGRAGHLWYLYVLLIFYMLLPIFKSIVSKTENVLYLIVLWCVGSGILQYMVELNVLEETKFYVSPHIFNGLWGYLFLGYWLSRQDEKKLSGTTYIIGSVGICIILSVVIIYQTAGQQKFQNNIVSYSGIPIIVVASGVFLATKQMRGINIGWIKKAVHFLARISFAVYLNQFIARFVANKIVGKIGLVGFGSMLLVFTLTTVFSIGMALLVYKLPNAKACKIIKKCMGI